MIRADRELLRNELKEAMKIDRAQPRARAMYLSLVHGLGVVARHAFNCTDHLALVHETDVAELKSQNDKLEQRLSALTKRVTALEKK